MINIGVKIDGIEQAKKEMSLDTKIIDHALELTAILIEGEAKRMCPVKTGRLQKSIIHYKSRDMEQTILANTDYAEYIEFGTYRIPVGTPEQPLITRSGSGKYPSYRPFLRPAFYHNQQRIMQLIENRLNQGSENVS